MVKRMLIDATHPEETRVAVVSGNRLEEFDYETSTKKQLKGNIYLAKVTKVEPSLQAAFVEYGGNRHGFLAFSEIHPDYYRIPISDREALMAEEAEAQKEADAEARETEDGEEVEIVGGDGEDDIGPPRRKPMRRYKIQEVISKRQIVLVQVVKEERGTKGAALTTYISLPGRYCVLMPNTPRGGGISRKITNAQDRKRLKSLLEELSIPDGMAVILRTAGMERSKAEIKRDYEYLIKLWDEIREETLQSTAPALIYEEADLIRRAIRDLYTRDIEEVFVEGEEGYRTAKDFMKRIMPSHARRVQPYKDGGLPMFHRHQVESQIDGIHSPVVQLKSGGYIVINPTEALVAIDVNSGRSTRERNIEETALRTNLEAAEEVARQLRLRDLAGLIVIDFIDMDEHRNQTQVERRFKEAMKNDRARVQIGRISPFGLLELSRQRLRPSLLEASTEVCSQCGGTGYVRSTESTALQVLRVAEEEGMRKRSREITIYVPPQVAVYVLNRKRAMLGEIEARYGFRVYVEADETVIPPDLRVDRVSGEPDRTAEMAEEERAEAKSEEDRSKRSRRGERKRSRKQDAEEQVAAGEPAEEEETEQSARAEGEDEEGQRKRPRRRGRRGGRRRSRKQTLDEAGGQEEAGAQAVAEAEEIDTTPQDDREPAHAPQEAVATDEGAAEAATQDEETPDEAATESKPAKRRSRAKSATAQKPARRSRAKAKETAGSNAGDEGNDEARKGNGRGEAESRGEAGPSNSEDRPAEPEPDAGKTSEPAEQEEDKKPRRRGWWNRMVTTE